MIRLFIILILPIVGVSPQIFAEEREPLGLPECELIVGSNRYIEIGNTISYTIDYLENNKYRCDDFKGNAHEIVSCTYTISHAFEVLLIVDNGIVTDIETYLNGQECTYFNVKPLNPPRKPNLN